MVFSGGILLKFKNLKKNLKVRIVTGFFQRIISQMIVPFISVYLASFYGATIAGFLTIIIIITGILSSFLGGYVSDNKGRRPVILIAEFTSFLALLLMALFNSPWIINPIITYILFLVSNALTFFSKPALDAMVIDITTPKERKYVFSINYWSINLSISIAAIIGSIFYQNYFFEVLVSCSIGTLVIFIVFLLFIKESKPDIILKPINENSPTNNFIRDYQKIIMNPIFLKFFIASVLMLGIESQLMYYISVRLTEDFPTTKLFHQWSLSGLEVYSFLRFENTIGVVVLALCFKSVLRNYSDKSKFYVGIVLFTLGFSILGFSNSFWILVISMFVLTFGEIIYIPIKQAILSILVVDNHRTKYMAVYGLHQRFGMIIASLTLTISPFLNPYFISFIMIIMGIGSVFFYRSVINEKETKQLLEKIS